MWRLRFMVDKLRNRFRNFVGKAPVMFFDDRDAEWSISINGETWSDLSASYYGDDFAMMEIGDIAIFLNAHENWLNVIKFLYDKETGTTLNLLQLVEDSNELKKVKKENESLKNRLDWINSNARFPQDA